MHPQEGSCFISILGAFYWRLERQAQRRDVFFFILTHYENAWISHAVVLRGFWAPQPPAIAQSSHGAAPEPRSPLRRNAEARRDAKFRDTFGSPHAFYSWHLVFFQRSVSGASDV